VSGSSAIDVPQLYRLHAQGATIVLNRLHAIHPPLAELCAKLEEELSAACQTNVYLSPPRAQGFKAHFDTHDVFVLQLHGSKRWRLYGSPVDLPLPGQAEDVAPEELGQPVEEIELKTGDTLYVPRGVVHDAVSLDRASMHATLGVLSYTWADVLLESLAAVILRDAAFRRSLPRGFASEQAFDGASLHVPFRDLIGRFSATADVDSVVDLLRDELVDNRRPFLRGQMFQPALADTLGMDSVLVRRRHLAYRIRADEAAIHVRCLGKQISLPLAAADAVRYMLDTPQFTVRQVPFTGTEGDRLVLARRLVKEGVLTIDAP
jgi:hypothetical protein